MRTLGALVSDAAVVRGWRRRRRADWRGSLRENIVIGKMGSMYAEGKIDALRRVSDYQLMLSTDVIERCCG